MNKRELDERKEMIAHILKHGKQLAGRNEALRHLRGERLTMAEAIRAHCYTCNNIDGMGDCVVPVCEFHRYMVYNPGKENYTTKVLPKKRKAETAEEFIERMEREKGR